MCQAAAVGYCCFLPVSSVIDSFLSPYACWHITGPHIVVYTGNTHTHFVKITLSCINVWRCFRSEQYFGSPTETAAAAEGVRERLLLVEERRLQLQEAGLHNEEEEDDEILNGQDARLDVIGEELSEKEEQEDEEEEEQQDKDLERATQDR